MTMHNDTPITLRLVQTISIVASSWMAGQVCSFSIFTVPRLLESPTPVMLRQWVNMFWAGKSVGQPSSIVIALSYMYLHYASHSSLIPFFGNTVAISYAVAAMLSMSVTPYTLIVLNSTNVAIFKREAEVSKAEKDGRAVEERSGEESAQVLLRRWAVLNLGRVVLLLGSAVLGAWTTINN